MTDFKIDIEDLGQGVRISDSMSEQANESENPIALIAENLGVNEADLTKVAMGRAMMLGEATALGQLLELIPGLEAAMEAEIFRLSCLSSAWLDGFFVALHIIEQKIEAGELTLS